MNGAQKSSAIRLRGVRLGIVTFGTVCALSAASATAWAQITPPVADPPTELAPPPAGYPPTVAPSSAGPYFARPAWDQTLPPQVRFVILTNFNSEAVLDRETGLVWARTNDPGTIGAQGAQTLCDRLFVGGRGGWRLPAKHEVTSLIDLSIPIVPGQPRFPAGHPFFFQSQTLEVWTGEVVMTPEKELGSTLHRHYVDLESGQFFRASYVLSIVKPVWCVRGAH